MVMYAQAIQGVSSFLGGMFAADAANSVARTQADTSNYIKTIRAQTMSTISKGQAEVNRGIQAGNNEVIGVENARDATLTAMQRWAQGVRNKRVLESVANNQAALTTNFNRQRDAKTRQNFAQTVKDAEETGRQAAAAAASGITGNVVDAIQGSTAIRMGMSAVTRSTGERQALYDQGRRESQTLLAGLDQIDYSPIFDNPRSLDYTPIFDNPRDTDYTQTSAQTQNVILAGLANNGALKNLAQGGASLFSFSKPASDPLDAFLTLNNNFSYKD